MSNINYLLLPVVVIIAVGFFILSSPEVSYAQPSDCCFANGTTGCDNSACEAIVCGTDPFCCDVFWDGICASAALSSCEICMDVPPPTGPPPTGPPEVSRVPTLGEWGTIALAGILGLIGFVYLFTKRKQHKSY